MTGHEQMFSPEGRRRQTIHALEHRLGLLIVAGSR